MCGRFVRHTNVHELARLNFVNFAGAPERSYNVAPSQTTLNACDAEQGRVLEPMRWRFRAIPPPGLRST